MSIITGNFSIEDGATATVSSTLSGEAGNLDVRAQSITLNNNASLTATNEESEIGGNITLQGINDQQPLQSVQVTNSLISASTENGQAGNLNIVAADSVQLSGTVLDQSGQPQPGGLSVEATNGGTAGNLTVNTGEFLIRDGSEVSVSSPQGEAGNLNVTASSLRLNQGSITAKAGQGEGGANINLDVSGFLRLDNESLISALATGNATGGNININAQYVIASFPTGSEGSDIVADAELGNGGRITINALGIFGLEFRPAQTPLNDITASSQGGAAGTVQITTLGIDPSRGLAALPLNFIDVSGLVGGQCSASGADGELSQFTIIGRGGLPLNPTDPLAPEAEASDWVTFDPESDRISPQAHAPIRITPFTSSVTPQQLAQFPSLCYQSWSTSAIAP
jgi:large exoprotein involved in heme utilization and adhesion